MPSLRNQMELENEGIVINYFRIFVISEWIWNPGYMVHLYLIISCLQEQTNDPLIERWLSKDM